jgi:hypothetical protein
MALSRQRSIGPFWRFLMSPASQKAEQNQAAVTPRAARRSSNRGCLDSALLGLGSLDAHGLCSQS